MRKIIVIGGGPAGMMAAITAAENGASVELWDGNEKTGKKLYLTGKGRCNVTNACGNEDFFKNVPRNGRFLRSSYAAFDNMKLMDFFEGLGVPLKVERGDRVFPASDKSSDIIRALTKRMEALGVDIHLYTKCEGLLIAEGRLTACVRNGERVNCDAAILATGGLSYPSTGSTGDGYAFAKAAGHAIVEPAPSLVPLTTAPGWTRELPGLTLRNVTLSAYADGKRIFREMGEMLFTHFGISGPLVLSLSAHLPQDAAQARVTVDMKPALTREQLAERIVREFDDAQRKQLISVLRNLLPGAMAQPFAAEVMGMDPYTPVNQVTRPQRNLMIDALKAVPLPVTGRRSVDEAVITRGGVDTREVTPRTMESKLAAGLYFAGEILDIDGYTGGFNLQVAFTTGRAAGKWAAQEPAPDSEET